MPSNDAEDAEPEEGEPDERTLDAARQQHVGRLLLDAHRAFAARALAKLRARGHPRLTLAHVGLLPHLEVSGTRLTELAARARMTKQAAGQLIDELSREGYVARTPDPADRRAVRVTFTAEGWRFLMDAEGVKAEIVAEYRAVLGEARFVALEAALAELVRVEPGS